MPDVKSKETPIDEPARVVSAWVSGEVRKAIKRDAERAVRSESYIVAAILAGHYAQPKRAAKPQLRRAA